jgi:tetratricopeptide (TPR) repeat protein
VLRGLALMLEGQPAKAVQVFDAVIAKDPGIVEARFNRAVALLKLGETAKAAKELGVLATDEKTGSLRGIAAYHYAIAADRLGEPAEAEAWLERSLTLDPSFDAARLLLGSMRERRGDVEGAAKAYLDYLKRNPDSALAALRVGVCAQRAGRKDVALSYLRRAIDKAPRSPEATEARKYLVMWE